MRRALASLGLLLASLAFSVTLAECGLRLHHYGSLRGLSGEHSLRMPHPSRGWTLAPDGWSFQRTRDYGVLVRTNAQGLRDRPHAYEKPAGIFRIVVLGDSFMEAYQVALEESLPWRLQEQLAPRGVEVVNLGIGGYGTAQQLRYLEEEGLRYAPDLVVLAFFGGNDISNNARAIESALMGADEPTVFSRPYATAAGLDAPLAWTPPDAERMAPHAARWHARQDSSLDALRRFFQPAMVVNLLEQAGAQLIARLTQQEPYDPSWLFGWPFLESVPLPEAARAWDEAWLVTRRLMLEMDRVARGAGARFAIVLVPAHFQVAPGDLAALTARHPELSFDVGKLGRELASFCAEAGIPLLDPTPDLARAHESGTRVYFWLEDRHWNAAGHALVTDRLAEFLDAQGLVPPARGVQPSSTAR
jgi:lysophospholipase L1-like esterase